MAKKETSGKSFDTIHIFGYGETQVIGALNKKVLSDKLTKVQAVVDEVYSKKPKENKASNDYHQVVIFNGGANCQYQTKGKDTEGWSVAYKDIDSKKVEALVAEIAALP